MNSKASEISDMLDDAIEDEDFSTVKKIVGEGVTVEILMSAMDTAYRGTKVDPPIPVCFEMVKYFNAFGIPIPTYDFYLKKRLN